METVSVELRPPVRHKYPFTLNAVNFIGRETIRYLPPLHGIHVSFSASDGMQA